MKSSSVPRLNTYESHGKSVFDKLKPKVLLVPNYKNVSGSDVHLDDD